VVLRRRVSSAKRFYNNYQLSQMDPLYRCDQRDKLVSTQEAHQAMHQRRIHRLAAKAGDWLTATESRYEPV